MVKTMDLYLNHCENPEKLDELLGFNVSETEKSLLDLAKSRRPSGSMENWGSVLHEGNQTWVGLALGTLQTPYQEIKKMCDLLMPVGGEKVVDLGAGYGRMGVVLGLFYPACNFLGFEFVAERVDAGARVFRELGFNQATLLRQDLTSPEFEMPPADYYFIYDYGKVEHIRHTLRQLDQMADRKKFKVIARGQGTRSLIEKEYPWLSQVYRPHHEENFSIYSMSF